MMIFVDSNIWCYYFDKSSKEHEKVSRYLEKTIENEKICVNTVILMEVSHFLLNNLGAVKGKKKVDTLTSLPIKITDFDYQSFQDSTDIMAENLHTGIGGRDATIIEAMKQKEIKNLVTHDKAFKKIKEIEVIDPMEEKE